MRRAVVAAVAAAVVATGAAACSDDGDAGAFCDRVGAIEDVGSVLNQLDTSDPGDVEARVQDALDDFASLEADAPGEVRDDVARVRQGVELVLDAVRDNPDDLAAARAQIAENLDELTGLVTASDNVVRYASDECDLDLAPVGVDDPAGDEPAGDTTTTEG